MSCLRWLLRGDGGGGVRALYRGFGVMILRDVPSYGVYTVVYESLLVTMIRNNLTDKHGVVANLVSGGMAGVVCWGLIIPFDVVKSLMQADPSGARYSSVTDCVRQTYRTCGVRGFFTGITVCCLRAFPVNAVTFLFYNKCLHFLNDNVSWEFNTD